MYRNSKGFTLPEVLITLSIMGIVAALTISSVIVKFQKYELYTRFIKAYNIFNKVYVRLKTENLIDSDDYVGMHGLNDEILSSLKYTVKCKANDNRPECYKNINAGTKTLSGHDANNPAAKFSQTQPLYSLPNGTDFQIGVAVDTMPPAIIRVNYVLVDTNGIEKEPNVQGRDRFAFFFYPYQRSLCFQSIAYYHGGADLSLRTAMRPPDNQWLESYCSTSRGNSNRLNGVACGLKMLREGKMSY